MRLRSWLTADAIALAAIAITAPLLVQAFALERGAALAPWIDASLRTLSALGTALVCTAGQMYLAHKLGQRPTIALFAAWSAAALGTTMLGGAYVLSEMVDQPITTVLVPGYLAEHWMLALYAALHLLLPEGIAASAMLAHARTSVEQPAPRRASKYRASSRVAQPAQVPAQASLALAPVDGDGGLVVVECSLGCGWAATVDPDKARRAEAAHRGSKHREAAT